MSGFSLDWLALREVADHAARDRALLQAANLAAAERMGSVVDLGAGSGSTVRACSLAVPIIPEDRFLLLDHDADLLAAAVARHGGVQVRQQDLSDISALPLASAAMVTASALFDLMSAQWISGLVAALHSPLYAALNYDGTTEWSPGHPLDAAVLSAFNHHQTSDKGTGAALGPGAISYLVAALHARGFAIEMAASPWQLGPSQAALAIQLIDGIASAVAETGYLSPTDLADWRAYRLKHVTDGQVIVGHQDIFAVPPNAA